jgi:large subunit ribosomal protein L25
MDATLEAVKRDGRGKNEANRLRAGGKIPAVFYGPAKDGKGPQGVAVAVDPKAVLRILHSDTGANTLINLKFEGLETRVSTSSIRSRITCCTPTSISWPWTRRLS